MHCLQIEIIGKDPEAIRKELEEILDHLEKFKDRKVQTWNWLSESSKEAVSEFDFCPIEEFDEPFSSPYLEELRQRKSLE